jgi:hypothetical protein
MQSKLKVSTQDEINHQIDELRQTENVLREKRQLLETELRNRKIKTQLFLHKKSSDPISTGL